MLAEEVAQTVLKVDRTSPDRCDEKLKWTSNKKSGRGTRPGRFSHGLRKGGLDDLYEDDK